VGGNRALMLVEEAHPPDELDVGTLREKLQRAEQEIESTDEGSEQRRVAERDKRRWETFIAIAEGGGGGGS
jgi:F-type H+-transporting ATPase subunit epsilon